MDLWWNFDVLNNCYAFLFPSSEIQFYHLMKHVTTMGKKHIMLMFNMLNWGADGETDFKVIYLMLCILLSSEVRHSLKNMSTLKTAPPYLHITIQDLQYMTTSPAGKTPFTAKFPLFWTLLLVYEIKLMEKTCDQCHMCWIVSVYVASFGKDLIHSYLCLWAGWRGWYSLRLSDSSLISRVQCSKKLFTNVSSIRMRYNYKILKHLTV